MRMLIVTDSLNECIAISIDQIVAIENKRHNNGGNQSYTTSSRITTINNSYRVVESFTEVVNMIKKITNYQSSQKFTAED